MTSTVALSRRDALFLDFDGTLAPLQDDADSVRLLPAQMQTLHRLHHCLDGAICLISGRDLDDLCVRTPDGLARVGNHGLRRSGVAGGLAVEAPPSLTHDLQEFADAKEGVSLELKGPVLALHYRQMPDTGPEADAHMRHLVSDYADYTVEHGKYVIEAKPVAASKGRALVEIMSRPPFHGRRPVMFGDDVTDEAAFGAAQSLGGLGVKVGTGPSRAHARLEAPSDVFATFRTFLDRADP